MTEICTTVLPVPLYHVRRRKYGEVPCLIARNHYYRLDELSDAIWRACTGERTMADVAEHIAAAREIRLSEAMAATLIALEFFRVEGLLEYR